MIKDSFISNEECASIIQIIERYARGEAPYQPRVRTERRTEIPARLLLAHGLAPQAAFLKSIRQRCHSEIEKHFNLPHKIYPEFMMLQGNYRGDGHVRHADNCRYDAKLSRWVPNHTPDRIVTCGVYLNECGVDFTGGELVFPGIGKTVPPRSGLFVAYPSNEHYEHEVPAVQSGARYSILLWFTAKTDAAEPL